MEPILSGAFGTRRVMRLANGCSIAWDLLKFRPILIADLDLAWDPQLDTVDDHVFFERPLQHVGVVQHEPSRYADQDGIVDLGLELAARQLPVAQQPPVQQVGYRALRLERDRFAV